MNNNRMNWASIAEDAETATSGTSGDYGSNSNYLKMTEGVHKLRIVPAGNDEEEKPYKKFARHELPIQTTEGRRTAFFLCWNYIKENQKGIAAPLAQQQKLTREDVKLAKQFGCPVCNAQQAMMGGGVSKDIWVKLNPQTKFIWNVINRADGQLYVWTTSKTVGGKIVSAIHDLMEEAELNPLDLRVGYDYQIRATGNGLARRYPDGMFLPIPKPLIKGGDIDSIQPYNLTENVMGQFKNYQATIDVLNEAMGSILARIGYEIPGDGNNWNREEDDNETRVAKVLGQPKKLTKKDMTPADKFFNEAVPPSDEDDEEEIFQRTRKNRNPIKANKQVPLKRKPIVEDDDEEEDAFSWDDDE